MRIGHVLIEGIDHYRDQKLKILFQNEFLIAKRILEQNEETIVATPQIISIHYLESLLPITTDQLRYGNRCKVFNIPVAEKWLSEEALSLSVPARSTCPKSFPIPDFFQGIRYQILPLSGKFGLEESISVASIAAA